MDTTNLPYRLREFLKTEASPFSSATGLLREAADALADHDATITSLQAALNEMHIRAVDAEAGFPCIAEREATIAKLNEHKAGLIRCFEDAVNENADLRAEVEVANKALAEARKDRASIVAFLAAEAGRFDRSARSASGDFVYDKRALEISCDKLRAQADIIRSLAAQIARGDDRQGGE